jgi:hypothetical protein
LIVVNGSQVELFWWRAFEDTNQQVFCLVNPDVLDYNVSQTAVKMFNILMQELKNTRISVGK